MSALLEASLTRQQRYRRAVERLIGQRDRLTDAQLRSLFRLLDDVRRQTRDDLGSLAAHNATSYQASQLRALQAAIDRLALDLVRRFRPLMGGALDVAWEAGAAFAPAGLAAAGVTLGLRDLDRTALVLAQETAADLVPHVGSTFRLRARRAIVLGVAGAKSPHAVTAEIADLLRTQPSRAKKSAGAIAWEAETIMRTEMMSAFNQADAARTEQLTDAPGLRKWWDSASDKRVRPDHAAAEARYRPGGSEGPIALNADFLVGGERAGYPHDPRLSANQRQRCRCVRLLWHPEWEG